MRRQLLRALGAEGDFARALTDHEKKERKNAWRRVLDRTTPDHLALAYGAWAPVGTDGKVPDSDEKRIE